MTALAKYGQRNIVACKNLRSKRHIFRVPACISWVSYVVGECTNILCVIHCVCHSLLSHTSLPHRPRPRECLRQGRWFTEWVFGFVLKFFSNSKYCEFLKVKDSREHIVFGSQMKIPRCWEVQFSLKVTKIFRGKGDGDKIWCAFFHFIISVDC